MSHENDKQPFVKMTHELYEKIMMSKFNREQRAILDLVIRLSIGVQRNYCHIPRQKDFELVGVYESHVKKQLQSLVDMNVLAWDVETGLIVLNENIKEWKVPQVPKYDEEMFNYLLHHNLQISKNNLQISKDNLQYSKLTYNKVRKHLQISKKQLTNKEEENHLNIDISRNETLSKDSIKESKENNNVPILFLTPQQTEFFKVLKSIPNYPFDEQTDYRMYNTIEERYPSLDIVEAVKSFSIYLLDKPLKKKSNSRSQFNTHCKKCIEWNKCLKQKPVNQFKSNKRKVIR